MDGRLPFELRVPGTWLVGCDNAWGIQTQLSAIESVFAEAVMAWVLFEQTRTADAAVSHRRVWEQDHQRRAELSQAIRVSAVDGGFDPIRWDAEREQVDVQLLREKWRAGVIPRQLQHQAVFIHAKAFLHAVDMVGKLLRRLASAGGVPTSVREVIDAFETSFPTLRHVRDSVQHFEDRSRGVDRKGHPLDLKPIDNELIHAPQGGVLALNNLIGNRFGATMADGRYGEIEVSGRTAASVRDLVEALYARFTWRGPGRVLPY